MAYFVAKITFWTIQGQFDGTTRAKKWNTTQHHQTGPLGAKVSSKSEIFLTPPLQHTVKQVTTSNNFDVMDASVRQCQFEQSWAQCKREAHRQQVSFIFQFQPENVKHRLETLVAAILRVYISTQIW